MSFCRFCGKELVNGQCDCKEFQESIGNTANTKDTRQQYQEPYQKRHEPFLVQSFHPNFSSFSGLISSVRDQTGISEASSAVDRRAHV